MGGWGGGGGWWVVHGDESVYGGEAVFGMPVFAIFLEVEICPFV